MADKSAETASPQAAESRYAVLFELDTVAVWGRSALYDVLSGILAEHKIKLTPVQFARYAHHSDPASYLPALLADVGAKKLVPAKVAADLANGLAMYYTSDEARLQPALEALVKEAAKQSIALAAISALGAAAAEALVEKLGLGKFGVRAFTFEASDEPFPGADCWLKMSKSLQKSPRNCMALVSSGISCRSALSAGMHGVALPDRFTVHQDFGGADALVEPGGKMSAAALIEEFLPAPART